MSPRATNLFFCAEVAPGTRSGSDYARVALLRESSLPPLGGGAPGPPLLRGEEASSSPSGRAESGSSSGLAVGGWERGGGRSGRTGRDGSNSYSRPTPLLGRSFDDLSPLMHIDARPTVKAKANACRNSHPRLGVLETLLLLHFDSLLDPGGEAVRMSFQGKRA